MRGTPEEITDILPDRPDLDMGQRLAAQGPTGFAGGLAAGQFMYEVATLR